MEIPAVDAIMTTVTILAIFCALLVISLATVNMVNQRQLRARVVRKKVSQLRRQVNELEDLIDILDQLVDSRAIVKLVAEEITDMLRYMTELDSKSAHLDVELANAELRSAELAQESGSRRIHRLLESDAQLVRAQHALTETRKILQHQHARNRITAEQLEKFVAELSWASVQVSAITYIGQGHKAMNKTGVVGAHPFYLKARQLLLQANHPDQRRTRMIREISEMVEGKRSCLSLDLMPETQYNPEKPSENAVQNGDLSTGKA